MSINLCIGVALVFFSICVRAAWPPTEMRSAVTQRQVADSGAIIEPSFRMTFEGAPWDYEIRVGLPPSYYKSSTSYPVLWVTDGSIRFESSVSLVNLAAAVKEVPEMVVISIGAPPEAAEQFGIRRTYDFSANAAEPCGYPGPGKGLYDKECRQYFERIARDGLGGATGFLAFMIDDVRAAIKKKYRVSDDDTLFGNSRGGTLCGYALLTRPEAFDRYVCGSPILGELFALEERYANTHDDLKAKVFFAAGEGEILQGGQVSALGVVSGMTRMAEILQLRGYPSLSLHVRIFPDRVHGPATADNSLYWGLRALFSSPDRDQR